MSQVVQDTIRKSRQLLPPLDVTIRAHCGCGWKMEEGSTATVINDARLHTDETGHVCHFQGEVRPIAQRKVVAQ
jgi:hypothetical protein